MRFSTITSLLAASGLAAAQAPMPAAQVCKNVQTLTTKSQVLIAPAGELSITNAPLLLIGLGPWPKVILGLGDIVATATGVIGGFTKTTYQGNDAMLIGDAFRTFVNVHIQLLNVLIGKAGFLTQIPFVGPPVTAVLRLIESVVDTLAFAIIDCIAGPVQPQMKTDLTKLDGTVTKAITCYTMEKTGATDKEAEAAAAEAAKTAQVPE